MVSDDVLIGIARVERLAAAARERAARLVEQVAEVREIIDSIEDGTADGSGAAAGNGTREPGRAQAEVSTG